MKKARHPRGVGRLMGWKVLEGLAGCVRKALVMKLANGGAGSAGFDI